MGVGRRVLHGGYCADKWGFNVSDALMTGFELSPDPSYEHATENLLSFGFFIACAIASVVYWLSKVRNCRFGWFELNLVDNYTS